MEPTVDRDASTEESAQGTAESFRNKTTEEAIHRIVLKYNHDLPSSITSHFTTKAVEKNVGEDFLLGRGNEADVILNDSKIPRRFVSIVSRVKEGSETDIVFILKNCTTKKRVPFKNHQKDTQHIGPEEEKELRNGSKFQLMDVKFTFHLEYGDMDSTKVELLVTRSEEIRTDADRSWYEDIGSARPPGGIDPRVTSNTLRNMHQPGFNFPPTMPQFSVPAPALLQSQGQAVFPGSVYAGGAQCLNNPYFSSQLPGHYTMSPSAPFNPCQNQPCVYSVVYSGQGAVTDSNPDKTKSVFSPSPTTEVGLGFPYASPPMHDTCRHNTNSDPNMEQISTGDRKQPCVPPHVGLQMGIRDLQSGAGLLPHTPFPPCQGIYTQRTISHPGYLGVLPVGEVPRGPPLETLGSSLIGDFSAMRLQTPIRISRTDTSTSKSSALTRDPTEHEDVSSS